MDLPAPTPEESAHSERLLDRIRGEIRARGMIEFARFMELALYAPGLGYYSAGKTKFGAAGDFVTAPELGSVFARCVARAAAPALKAAGPDAVWYELGGGSGAFAEHVLAELARLDALPTEYWLLEPSAELRQRQEMRVRTRLPAAQASRVRWLDGPPQQPWSGVLFANEVLDSLPVTRFVIRGGEVRVETVTLDASDRLVRAEAPADAMVEAAVRHVERRLDAPFADGYRSELLPILPYWISAVAGELRNGLAIFVDYGYPRREFYLPERRDGTLLCHYRHRAHGDPLRLVGLQDITASVDFTALAEAGSAAGFDFLGYAPQSQFLIAAGLPDLLTESVTLPPVEQARLSAEVRQLTLPGEMGERFQVMLFGREATVLSESLIAIDRSERL
jgi:SAM-dependent MidA family methyltransferase